MSNAFDEEQFPPSISFGARFGPGFNTKVVTLSSGSEKRNQNWSMARYQGDVSTGIKQPAQMDAFLAFFVNRAGRARGFRFKDWKDFQAVDQAVGGTVDGSNTVFQLQKIYTTATRTYTRTILKPVSGTVLINGHASGFTLDTTTGLVTMTTAPSVRPLASFEFDVPVRFDIDLFDPSIEDISAEGFLSIVQKIPILELKNPDA
jgi:uncharacterized protein (TIGR02217 family)